MHNKSIKMKPIARQKQQERAAISSQLGGLAALDQFQLLFSDEIG